MYCAEKENSMWNANYREDLKNLISILALVLILFLLVFGHLYRNVKMAELRYEVERQEKKKQQLQLDVQSLRFQVARYSRMDRVDTLFRDRFGYLPVQLSRHIMTLQIPDSPEKDREEKRKK